MSPRAWERGGAVRAAAPEVKPTPPPTPPRLQGGESTCAGDGAMSLRAWERGGAVRAASPEVETSG